MGLLGKLFGRDQGRTRQQHGQQPYADPRTPQHGGPQDLSPAHPGEGSAEDARAVERYQYLLRTAPPEQIEQAHAEAFAKLTPEQRRQVLTQLSQNVPEHERPRDDSPQTLARSATRMEMQRPGSLSHAFGGAGGRGFGAGPGIGTLLLSTVAGAFIGTAIAQAMFDDPGMGADQAGEGAEGAEGAEAAGGDAGGADAGAADAGGADFGGADAGGGFDFGGGGDFGGGDFGGF